MAECIWKDRKRIIFGLPWSFTKYSLTEEKLTIETGVLNRREEEIRLYRIMDITLKRSLRDRIWGVGTIHCCSADKTAPEFDIKRIRNPRKFRDTFSDLVEEQREKKRVSVREYIDEADDEHEE